MSDISAMTEAGEIADHKLQMLVLERRNAGRNMARFYVLAIEPTLFGEMALVRESGRIGSMGRRRLDLYPNRASAAESLDAWLVRKARRGYRVRVLRFPGSASLSVLFGLIGRLADKREHAKEHGLGSWAGRADFWGRAGWRSLGDLCRGTGNRLLSRMQRAVDTSAQPVCSVIFRTCRCKAPP